MNELIQIGKAVEQRLDALTAQLCEDGILKDAMRYSLLGGGKRLRPALCLMAADIYKGSEQAMDLACAIEMIHTYSLIHDDLPAMDNDVLRRGKPTSHVVFGEAYALLAGDGLLNCAFEVMLQSAEDNKDSGLFYTKAMKIIANAAGINGMIAGQVADMAFEGKGMDKNALHYIHQRKTAALIRASVVSGAALVGADEHDLEALGTYGDCIGLVFQIMDDILDEEGSTESLGKSAGKDKKSGKLTFLSAYGLEASRAMARQKTNEAILALDRFGDRAKALIRVAEILLTRER